MILVLQDLMLLRPQKYAGYVISNVRLAQAPQITVPSVQYLTDQRLLIVNVLQQL